LVVEEGEASGICVGDAVDSIGVHSILNKVVNEFARDSNHGIEASKSETLQSLIERIPPAAPGEPVHGGDRWDAEPPSYPGIDHVRAIPMGMHDIWAEGPTDLCDGFPLQIVPPC
jgi:hypothetical protein